MASKSAQQEPVKAEVIEEALDTVDSALDRVKVLYEQYFLGIQKQPPQFLHADVERKLRDLAQLQIRNTAQRYRFATIQQKFGSYSTYWRRTLRQIEQGTYHRNLSKISRQAAATGAAIPEEILAAMPKRMREQVRRDREAQLALQRRRDGAVDDADLLTLAPLDEDDGEPGFVSESTDVRQNAIRASQHPGMHVLEEADADLDLDAFFKSIQTEDDEESTGVTSVPRPAAPASDTTSRMASKRAGRTTSAPAPLPSATSRMASPRLRAPSQAIARRERPETGEPDEGAPRRPPSQPGTIAGTAAAPPASPGAGAAARTTSAIPPPIPRTQPRAATPPPVPTQALPVTARPPAPVPTQSLPTQSLPVTARPPAAVPTQSLPVTARPPAPAPEPAASAAPAPAPPAQPAASAAPVPPQGRPLPPVSRPISRPPTPAAGTPATARGLVPPRAGAPSIGPTVTGAVRSYVSTTPGAGAPTDDAVPDAPHPSQPTRGTRSSPAIPTHPLETRPGFGPIRAPSTALPRLPSLAPSQVTRPNPIVPGSLGARPSVEVETMTGPFPREAEAATPTPTAAAPPAPPSGPPIAKPVLLPTIPTIPKPPAATPAPEPARPAPATPPPATAAPGAGARKAAAARAEKAAAEPKQAPPPGMTDADVNALYAKYVKAKEAVGQPAGPGSYGKLLKTIHAQAPKIMEQYKAKGVDFSVVVKDNEVIIRAKPKP